MKLVSRWFINTRHRCESGSLVLLALLLVFGITGTALAQCDPTAGDQIFAWVNDKVPELSRQLANADYDARIFNYMLIGMDDIQLRLDRVSSRLDEVAEHIRTLEQAGTTAASGQEVIDQAILRERDSQSVLDTLFDIQRDLQESMQRLQLLKTQLSAEEFRAAGLQNVGRETLIASLQDLGASAGTSLNDKYSVFVSVTVDESGNFEQARVIPQADMWDTIAAAIASKFGPPGWAVFAFAELTKFSIENDECNRKIQKQKERIQEAFRLLPQKLITPDQQYQMYQDSFSATLPLIKDQADKVARLSEALEARWAQLLAYDATRNAAAHSVLTSAKVDALRKAYGHDDHITNIFNNVMLADIAEQVSEVNSFIATTESTILLSCSNLQGLEAVEKQEDTLEYGEQSFDALLRQANFAPLHGVLNTSQSEIALTRTELKGLRQGLSSRTCSQQNAMKSMTMRHSIIAAMSVQKRISGMAQTRSARRKALVRLGIGQLQTRAALLSSTTSGGGLLCVLVTTDGMSYECGTAGTSYDSQFGTGMGDPRGDIFKGGNDGGYATDNRKVSIDISEVNSNVAQRIGDLRNRVGAAKNGLPSWTQKNGAAIDELHRATTDKEKQEQKDRDQFTIRVGPSVAFASIALKNFTQSPFDPSRVSDLVSAIGGADFSLPHLPSDALVPDAPRIIGFSAFERVYGVSQDRNDQGIIRERLKASRDLANSAEQLGLANGALDLAQKFSSSGSQSGKILAAALVRDSESLRYVTLHELPAGDISSVSADGTFGRTAWPNGTNLPRQSILARAQSFQAHSAGFDVEYSSLKRNLTSAAPDRERRQVVADEALEIAKISRSTFFSGAILDGERLLRMAHDVLDIATRFVPGVNLGRDVYEAISGVDLFTGVKLDTLGRTAAIVGVLTLGFEDEIEGGVKAIRLLGVSAEEDAEIIQASRTALDNRLNHIFGESSHNLDGLVQEFGGRQAAYEALLKAVRTETLALNDGLFEVTIEVGKQAVTVRGKIIDGVARIGTAFIKP